MQYLIKAVSSRTVWVIALMFTMGGIQATEAFMNPQVFMFLQAGLSFLAVHFKMTPSQDYSK